MATKTDAKIFRRGNKHELFESDCKQIGGYEEENQKLNELHELWKQPRSGRDLAAAIWREQHESAEVVLHKGKLLNHMGFQLRGRLHLHIEEAVFLVDRASMLLFVVDKRGKKRLLSLQEAIALMIKAGVSMELFSIYSKLMRAGYIVRRYKQDAQEGIMKKNGSPFSKNYSSSNHKPTKSKFTKPGVMWWPMTFGVALPLCEVEYLENALDQSEIWSAKAKPFASFQQISIDNHVSHHDLSNLVLEVYKGKDTFSRKDPGRPLFLVVHNKGPVVPPILEQLEIAEALGDVPVRYVPVEKGDVAFYAVAGTELTTILH